MQPALLLQRAIDKCYDIFAVYPRPDRLEASPLRDPAALLRTLTSAPLQELGGEQIGPYAGYALTTVGSVQDYKHFLPRILEFAVRKPQWMGTEPPVIGNRLRHGKWLDWPSAEQHCIRDLFICACLQAFAEHPDTTDAGPWLFGIAILEIDAPFEALQEIRSANSALQLANFLLTSGHLCFERDPADRAYWSYLSEKTSGLITDWMLNDAAVLKLKTARYGASSADQWRIEAALDELAKLRLARPQ